MPDSASLSSASGHSAKRFARRLVGSLLCIVFMLAASVVQAQTTDTDTDTTLDNLRKQIDTAQQSLKDSDKLTDADLLRLRASVTAAQAQATDMASQLAPQLTSVQARVAELGTPTPGAKEDPDVASQRTLLNKNRAQLDSQVKLARLLSVEGEQLAGQIWGLRRSQFQARLGERTDSILATPFWAELRDDLPRDAQRMTALGNDLKVSAAGAPLALWLATPLAVAAAWWLLRLAHGRLMQWLTTRVPPGRLRRSMHAHAVVVQ